MSDQAAISRLREEIRRYQSLIDNANEETRRTGVVEEWRMKIRNLEDHIRQLGG